MAGSLHYIERCKASCMDEVGKKSPCQAIYRRNPKGHEVQLLHDPLQAPYVCLIDLFHRAIFNPYCPIPLIAAPGTASQRLSRSPRPSAPRDLSNRSLGRTRMGRRTRRVSRRPLSWFPQRGKNLQKLPKTRRNLRKLRSRVGLCCIPWLLS